MTSELQMNAIFHSCTLLRCEELKKVSSERGSEAFFFLEQTKMWFLVIKPEIYVMETRAAPLHSHPRSGFKYSLSFKHMTEPHTCRIWTLKVPLKHLNTLRAHYYYSCCTLTFTDAVHSYV